MGRRRITPDDEQFLEEALGHSLSARVGGQSAYEKAEELRLASGRRSFLTRLLRPASADERHWTKGANGEAQVAAALRQLPPGWWVLHDIPVGDRGANIDHIVIGSGGVFTLNTKNLSGSVWVASKALLVSGQKTDYLRKAEWEAQRAGRLLTKRSGLTVTPQAVLVILARQVTVKEQPERVSVVSARKLSRWLALKPAQLSPAEVVEIMATADDPATWTTGRSAGGPARRTQPESLSQLQAAPPPPPPRQASGVAKGSVDPEDPRYLPADIARCICGGTLVLRHRRSDGHAFYGCTNYPACRQTRGIS